MKISRLVIIAGLVFPLFALGCGDGDSDGKGGSAGQGSAGKAGSAGKGGGGPASGGAAGTGGEAGTGGGDDVGDAGGAGGASGAGGVAGKGGDGPEVSKEPCTKGLEIGSACIKCREDNCMDDCYVCVKEAGSEKFNQKCVDVFTCLKKCSDDPQCVDKCLANPDLKDGLQDFFNWYSGIFSCSSMRCGASCGADVCGTKLYGGECGECINTKCQDMCRACAASPDCYKYLNCEDACGRDDACLDECVVKYPQGAKLAADWNGGDGKCVDEICKNECRLKECKSGMLLDPECDKCNFEKCLNQCNGCIKNESCMDYWSCLGDCSDEACENKCAANFPEGAKLMDAWQGQEGCLRTTCKNECRRKECGPNLFVDKTCSKCNFERCGTECTSCFKSEQCMDYWDCTGECSRKDDGCFDESGCMTACNTKYPNGKKQLEDWIGNKGCVDSKCTKECGVIGKGCQEKMLSGGDECNNCNFTKCKTQCDACINSEACMGFWDCMGPCEDLACQQKCDADFPGGMQLFVDWLADGGCLDRECKTECAKKTPTKCTFETLGGEGNPACGTCNCDKCRTECDACAASEDCQKLVYCLSKCVGDAMCTACRTDNPAGVALYDAWTGNAPGACTRTKCATECH